MKILNLIGAVKKRTQKSTKYLIETDQKFLGFILVNPSFGSMQEFGSYHKI
jgi:hypothetical protein